MPSIVGQVNITNVGSGVANFGDAYYLAPKSSTNTVAGSGSSNTGDYITTNTGISLTGPLDPNVNDQNQTGNA